MGSSGATGSSGSTGSSMMHMEMPTAAAFIPYEAKLKPHGWTASASSTAASSASRSGLSSGSVTAAK